MVGGGRSVSITVTGWMGMGSSPRGVWRTAEIFMRRGIKNSVSRRAMAPKPRSRTDWPVRSWELVADVFDGPRAGAELVGEGGGECAGVGEHESEDVLGARFVEDGGAVGERLCRRWARDWRRSGRS